MSFLATIGQTDAAAFLALALALAAYSLWRRRRPPTRTRVFEVSLSAILLVMVGLRYGAMALIAMAVPAAAFGPSVPAELAAALTALYGVVAVIGLTAHRGSVVWRVTGALAFAVAAVLEAALTAFVLDLSLVASVDATLALAVAALALVLAAHHWAYRSAQPNPLGGEAQPFDY